jgi:hypothetical protein
MSKAEFIVPPEQRRQAAPPADPNQPPPPPSGLPPSESDNFGLPRQIFVEFQTGFDLRVKLPNAGSDNERRAQ